MLLASGEEGDRFYPLAAVAAAAVVFALAHVYVGIHGGGKTTAGDSSALEKRLVSDDAEDAEDAEDAVPAAPDVEAGVTDSMPYATGDSPAPPAGGGGGDGPPPMSCCKKACRLVCTSITCLVLCALSPLNLTLMCCCGCRKKMCGDTKAQAAEKKEQRRRDQLERVQSPHPEFPFVNPGNGAPLLTGVRVIELATVIAGPSAGRILADNGAEVIRVEPPSGTMWRRYLNLLERDRKTFITSFEHVNFN